MRLSPWLRRAGREPLVHFLIAGLALFLFFAWRGSAADPASRTITIDETKVSSLAAQWAQTYQRAPTPDEIDALIRDYIREEIYYREALRLGLDQDDVVIRRRLRNKMEFLARAAAEDAQPDDAELQRWLDTHRSKYAESARTSFDQIYLGEKADAASALAARLKPQIAAGGDWKHAGVSIPIEPGLEWADKDAIARDFGDDFAARVGTLPVGSWQGPVASGYGFHLVRVRARRAAAPPALADVRQQVENDWRSAQAKQREESAYRTLLDAYTIRIAKP